MNGCIYRTKDGECDLYAEGGKYTAFCEMENCEGRKMSNADKIRSMTDEELCDFLHDMKAISEEVNLSEEWWKNWLNAEVSE